jgi:hypothetical protein
MYFPHLRKQRYTVYTGTEREITPFDVLLLMYLLLNCTFDFFDLMILIFLQVNFFRFPSGLNSPKKNQSIYYIHHHLLGVALFGVHVSLMIGSIMPIKHLHFARRAKSRTRVGWSASRACTGSPTAPGCSTSPPAGQSRWKCAGSRPAAG